jgi:membrane protein implicated in regulation of membrane protease activity
MTWTSIYLVCFLLGFSLSVVSWLLGALHLHLPHGVHGVHAHAHGHVHAGGAHAAHGPHAPHGPHGGADGYLAAAPSPFNFATATAFLAWFGGAGYLLTRYADLWPPVALLFAIAVGSLGASLVFWFMAKVLWSPQENLDPDDYDLVGLLGTVSIPIRAGGTGEILFAQAGARRAAGARSEDGRTIDKGVEVVITRFEKGLVYVRTWSELAADEAR